MTLKSQFSIFCSPSNTFCFLPDAGSPFSMLESIASMSLITRPKSLSQKLKTNYDRKITRQKKWACIIKHHIPFIQCLWCESDLLPHRETLTVEMLDKLGSHFVWVVGTGVGALLLKKVNLNSHGTNALLGFVKVVVGHWNEGEKKLSMTWSPKHCLFVQIVANVHTFYFLSNGQACPFPL